MDHSQAAEDHPGDVAEPRLEGPDDAGDKGKKVFPFSAPYKSWSPQMPSSERPTPAAPARDWSAALDLVNEAYEAIRIAEERASAAEAYSTQLAQYHAEQLRVAEGRLTASEKRAEAAEARARDAEEWLVKFHDTILDGFHKAKGRH